MSTAFAYVPEKIPPRDELGRFLSTIPAIERFARFLDFDPATGCVVWTGGTTMGRGHSAPYGSFWFEGKRWFAHRWAAKYIKGIIIDGFQVDHNCPHTGGKPNTLCVEHLQAVTIHEHVAFEQARKFIYIQVGLEEPDPVYVRDPNARPLYRPPEWFLRLRPDYRAPPPSVVSFLR